MLKILAQHNSFWNFFDMFEGPEFNLGSQSNTFFFDTRFILGMKNPFEIFQECRDLNLGLQGWKRERYLFAMQPGDIILNKFFFV